MRCVRTGLLSTTLLCVAMFFPGHEVAHAEDAAHPVRFEAGAAGSRLEPRFSPAASESVLKTPEQPPLMGRAHLETHLEIGAVAGKSRRLLLWRSAPDKPHDVLLFDANGNGDLSDERRVRARIREGKGSTWCTFELAIRVNHATVEAPRWQPYAIGLWVVVKDVADAPEKLFSTGHGYRAGRIKVLDSEFDVILSDANNDAVYGAGDYWTIRDVLAKTPFEFFDAREVGDFAWADGVAWKLELEGTAGEVGRIVGFDPGITQQADERKRDPCYEDRRAPRAETPLPLETDFDDGMAKARKQIAPYFLFFAAGQDMNSQNLEGLVFVQKAVVGGAADLVSIRIDMDEREDLVKRFGIKERPAGVLFSPQGGEVARFGGYRTGLQMVAFFSDVHPWLAPSDDEPVLKGKAKKRNAKEVKRIYNYLQGKKQPGLLVDRIADVGSQRNRAGRDALMKFAVKRKSKEYVAAAFRALARVGGTTAIEFLCGKHALDSGDFLVAQSAALALAQAKDPLATSPILRVMTNKRTKIEIVSACALALAQSEPKNPRVLEVILEFSGHRKDTIRAGAVEALGYIASDEAVARLKQVLMTDKNARVRSAAAMGFGHTKRPEFIPFLREAIGRENSHHVKTEGLAAIQKLQDPGAK